MTTGRPLGSEFGQRCEQGGAGGSGRDSRQVVHAACLLAYARPAGGFTVPCRRTERLLAAASPTSTRAR